jgi:uncharacterized protein YjbJ (UPF0337 family)
MTMTSRSWTPRRARRVLGATRPGKQKEMRVANPDRPNTRTGGVNMGDVKNKAEELKGKAKEKVGGMTDNKSMQAEGMADQAKAKAKQAAEDAKDAARDAFNR